ncbi:hypothetical protein [Salmonella enterica]|uniref:hypothetical protein n=1 Tax=Salmonella enterica TaxID=28901 RepID=UPI000BA0107F|nr:hypothetical protein [Salmonella enterica]EAA9276472.1 hypothetical protein [Salmonella enterica]EAU1485942.1 hypothetical protein [Salmonella enterica]OZU41340.1 hypothetical protein CCO53_00715 [Salmonella enterica subsp. enterica serovar Ekotedo]
MAKSKHYLPISTVSEQEHTPIKDIIDSWLNHDRNLYIYLNAVPCRLSRIVELDKIGDLAFSLTGKNSLFLTHRLDTCNGLFIPFDAHLLDYEEELMDDGGLRLNNEPLEIKRKQIMYNGTAHGLWCIQPTMTSNRYGDSFTIVNDEYGSALHDNSNAIRVSGEQYHERLLFNSVITIMEEELFVGPKDETSMYHGLRSVQVCNDDDKNNEKYSCETDGEFENNDLYISRNLNVRVALYVVIRAQFPHHKDGKLIYSKVSDDLKRNGMKTTASTVSGWMIMPKCKSYRYNENQEKALSIYLNALCEQKKIKKKYSDVVDFLNGLIDEYKLGFDVFFSEPEVSSWLKKR